MTRRIKERYVWKKKILWNVGLGVHTLIRIQINIPLSWHGVACAHLGFAREWIHNEGGDTYLFAPNDFKMRIFSKKPSKFIKMMKTSGRFSVKLFMFFPNSLDL